MAISYSGEGYKFQPQFANLGALQGLTPLDVTRRAEFELRPLTYAPVPSSRPELVSEGISKGILSAVGGITEGITAKYKAEQAKEEKKEERKHELRVAAIKASSPENTWLDKERMKFIAENSQRADFQERLDAFDRAAEDIKAKVPSSVTNKTDTEEPPISALPEEVPIVENPLPDYGSTAAWLAPEEKPEEGFSFSLREIAKATPAPKEQPQQAEIVAPEAQQAVQQAKQAPTDSAPATGVETPQQPPKVDYTVYEEPVVSGENKFETEKEARANKPAKNPDWEFDLTTDKDDWFSWKARNVRGDRIGEQQEKLKAFYDAQNFALKQQEAESKSNKITKDNVNQYKTQLEQASTSVKELDQMIDIINNNPSSVGGVSGYVANVPYTPARRLRGLINPAKIAISLNALMELKKAGISVGQLTEAEREALSQTEGALDLDRLEWTDILPRLITIRDARLKFIKSAVDEIKKVDEKYEPPSLVYPKTQTSKSKTQSSKKVQVISPDGQEGEIPESQVDEAIKQGYKLK